MNYVKKHTEVIGGKTYNCATATVIASDCYWDGHNWERGGTNRFLCRTPKGRFFVQHRSQWQGAADPSIQPVTREEAMALWDDLREHEVEYEVAFGIKPEEA